jgi:epoxyqueuosine reductase
LGKKLKKLCRFIQEELQGSARYYVDTGPLMERAYGETSRVGYIGKNSMLISQELGSWFFLGVVITGLKLSSDKKRLLIRCGDCTRCMAACPTGAIVADGVVDSNRCISYLTIENRGAIPTHLRKAMGDRIFGCDTCQEVCPHNVRARVCREEDFKQLRIPNRRVSLQEILEMDTDEAFTKRFRGTPIMRAKRRGLQRNACIAAGNSDNSSLIPVLKKFIASTTDVMLIEHANWAIAELVRK